MNSMGNQSSAHGKLGVQSENGVLHLFAPHALNSSLHFFHSVLQVFVQLASVHPAHLK